MGIVELHAYPLVYRPVYAHGVVALVIRLQLGILLVVAVAEHWLQAVRQTVARRSIETLLVGSASLAVQVFRAQEQLAWLIGKTC